MRESLRDHEGQFIERPMAKIEDDGEDSFFETVSVQGMPHGAPFGHPHFFSGFEA